MQPRASVLPPFPGLYQSGGNTFVEANVDANLGADFQIQLTGLKTLSAVDFVL